MTKAKKPVSNATDLSGTALLGELRGLIEQARQHVAQTANSTLTMLHWHVGRRIHQEILAGQRASYGEEILPTLSAQLMREYGQGFGTKNLARMIQFSEVFPDELIVVSLVRQLISNSALASPLWRGRSASRSDRMIFTSTCCFITGTCADWWR